MDGILDLVKLSKDGNEVAFAKLLDKFQNLLISMSKKYSDMCLELFKDNEDFLQEAKIAFFSAVKTYDESKDITFGAYAKVCVKNKLISCVRKFHSEKRKKASHLLQEQPVEVQEEAVSNEQRKQLYQLAKQHLSLFEYKIFEMYSGGQKAKEISSKINKSEKSVNNAIYRIKSKLAKLI